MRCFLHTRMDINWDRCYICQESTKEGLTVQALIYRTLLENVLKRLKCEIGIHVRGTQEEKWSSLEGRGRREIKSRAFVELTEYRENAVDNDTHFFILAELHIKLYSLQTKAHTLQSRYSLSITSSFGATISNWLFLICFNLLFSLF